jgi:hypothetical protein
VASGAYTGPWTTSGYPNGSSVILALAAAVAAGSGGTNLSLLGFG